MACLRETLSVDPRFHALVAADDLSVVLIYAQGHVDQRAATAFVALVRRWMGVDRVVLVDMSEVDGMDRHAAAALARIDAEAGGMHLRYPSAAAVIAFGACGPGLERQAYAGLGHAPLRAIAAEVESLCGAVGIGDRVAT